LGLRSFFSELFTYRALDRAGIKNDKKVVSGNQVLEGTCELNGKTFLFECRKLYMPGLAEIDIKLRVLMSLAQVKLKKGTGMICTINFQKPLIGKHRANFAEKIRLYFDGINKLTDAPLIRYEHADAFGSFKAINFSQAALQEAREKKDYEILYYLEDKGKLGDSGLHQFQGKILTNFDFAKSKVYDKLRAVLREKKRQHRDSPFQHKIIILDSEMLPEFFFSLFADGRMYDREEIARVYNELQLDSILCVIRRNYLQEQSAILTDIFRPPSLEKEAMEFTRAFHNI